MACYITEFFCYPSTDHSEEALKAAAKKKCAATGNKREVIGDTAGLNWENVSKRIIPQIICTGLYLVCPKPVYDRIIDRLGGTDKLPSFPSQPASINFIAYDICTEPKSGEITPLGIVEEHSTTVYKVQEAFSSMTLPDGNVYRDAISKILYPERFNH